MSKPTIRKWWANHWQVLNCPCDATPGKHHYPTHADAIQHVSEAQRGDIALFHAIRRIWRDTSWIYGLPRERRTPAHHTGRSFIKEAS